MHLADPDPDAFADEIERNAARRALEYMGLTAGTRLKDLPVDVVVLEVGMAGRLDATNVADGIVAVVTNVGLDHTAVLGPTRAHIAAEKGDFAPAVLMPGDPLRSKFIAETYLENPVLVNNVRGVQGHTGYYKGVKVSVMASGMGMPAIGIYSHELYNGYGVENIIRVGSAGSIQEKVKLYDLVIGQGACTDSNFAAQFHLPGTFAPIASWELLKEAVSAAEANGARYHVGNLNSSDVFYGDHEGVPAGLDSVYGLQKMGVLALEMEAAALYMNAARYGKRALAICTISDSLVTGEETTSQERQTAFTTMMKVALDVAVAMENR